ncbi:hypothetical protein JET14_15595 [Martelella lutilitoris]|uniref:Uncharacterized protein n=1 Tax=Martelella lutilitoris TaxID=2583532 RepID=A0A7T7HIC5_9HYPH|nr:hypothetical protein [Martelella lutilitoris]QQM29711.1 hypothetical protein JET14_15595 [Martelella lutilitoris]
MRIANEISVPGADRGAGGFQVAPELRADAAGGGNFGPAAVLDFAGSQYALTRIPLSGIAPASPSELAILSAVPFDRMVSFTRPGSATYVGPGGMLRIAAANMPRFDHTNGRQQLLLEGPATNKVLCNNANPTDLTGMGGSGAPAVLSVVDDTAALSAAGLSEVCASGKVYRLDNTAGTADAFAVAAGDAGNTALHSISAYVRAAAGEGYLRISGVVNSPSFTNAAYQRVTLDGYATTTGATFSVRARPGAVVYFILPQFEQSAVTSSPIVTSGGSAVTRPADKARLSDPVAALLQRDKASLLVQFEGLVGSVGRIMGGASYYPLLGFSGPDLLVDQTVALASGLAKPLPRAGAAFRFDRADDTIGGSYKGNAVVSQSRDLLCDTAKIYLGRDENATTADRFAAGWYDQLVIWPFRMTDADLQAKAAPYA